MPAPNNRYKLITHFNSDSFISEAYRTLRTNLQFATIDRELKTIVITSTIPGEGKSTTVSNLAIAYAQADKKVLLIDADLRKPTLHRIFAASNRWGLSTLLTNQSTVDATIQHPFVPNLSLITAGHLPPNPSELLGSPRMDALLAELKTRYDVVLVDTPPVLAVSDSQILAAKSDGVIYVLGYGKVKREAARKAFASMNHMKANVLGIVLNNKKRSRRDFVYYY